MDCGKGCIILLMVYGLGSNLKAWDKVILQLLFDYWCVVFDLLGYGLFDKGDYFFDILFFVEIFLQFKEVFKFWQLVFIGYFMGGQISIFMVFQVQEYFVKFILLALAGFECFNLMVWEWLWIFYKLVLLCVMFVYQIECNFYVNFYQFLVDVQFMIDECMVLRVDMEVYVQYCNMIFRCVFGMFDYLVFD